MVRWRILRPLPLALFVGIFFSPLASTAAFLITYEEYRKHFAEPGPALRHALRAAIVTLIVFLAITFVGVWTIIRWAS